MNKIQLFLIAICIKEVALYKLDPESIFNKKAEDIFNEKVGDIVEYRKILEDRRQINTENLLRARKAFKENQTLFVFPDTTTTEKSSIKLTTPTENIGTAPPAITMDEIKLKMKKAEINKLLREDRTYIPSFVNDDDDPNQLTKHFDLNITIPHSRRVYYHYQFGGANPKTEREEKIRITYIMIQFIYMTRRQMGYMTELRNKYKGTLRYQMGYLFGLRRMVKQQQMILYKTLSHYINLFSNAQIHLQFYYRIVMLSVDIHDIMRYIIKLNYKQNLITNPKYYLDSDEYFAQSKP